MVIFSSITHEMSSIIHTFSSITHIFRLLDTDTENIRLLHTPVSSITHVMSRDLSSYGRYTFSDIPSLRANERSCKLVNASCGNYQGFEAVAA